VILGPPDPKKGGNRCKNNKLTGSTGGGKKGKEVIMKLKEGKRN